MILTVYEETNCWDVYLQEYAGATSVLLYGWVCLSCFWLGLSSSPLRQSLHSLSTRRRSTSSEVHLSQHDERPSPSSSPCHESLLRRKCPCGEAECSLRCVEWSEAERSGAER